MVLPMPMAKNPIAHATIRKTTMASREFFKVLLLKLKFSYRKELLLDHVKFFSVVSIHYVIPEFFLFQFQDK
jgi:hypothetical protein